MPRLMQELMDQQRMIDPNGPIFPSLLALSDYGFLPFYQSYTPYIDIAFEY